MTHYKMNRLHLGCGESLSTFYRRGKSTTTPVENSNTKTDEKKKTKPMRQHRGS